MLKKKITKKKRERTDRFKRREVLYTLKKLQKHSERKRTPTFCLLHKMRVCFCALHAGHESADNIILMIMITIIVGS